MVSTVQPEAIIVPEIWSAYNFGVRTVTRDMSLNQYTKVLDADIDENITWLSPEILVNTQLRIGVDNPEMKEIEIYHFMNFTTFKTLPYHSTIVTDPVIITGMIWILNGLGIKSSILPMKTKELRKSLQMYELQNFSIFTDISVNNANAKFLQLAENNQTLLFIGCILPSVLDLKNFQLYKRFIGTTYSRTLINIALILLDELGVDPDPEFILKWSLDNWFSPHLVLRIYEKFHIIRTHFPNQKIDLDVKGLEIRLSEIAKILVETDSQLFYQYCISKRAYMNASKNLWFAQIDVFEENLVCVINSHTLKI